jgi:predicted transport protein
VKYILAENAGDFSERVVVKEAELTDVFSNFYKRIFSNSSYWIGGAKKLRSSSFRNFAESIPDGYLIQWETPDTPCLYLTELETKAHPLRHIVPQLGNYLSFIQSATKEDQSKVRDYLYGKICENKAIHKRITTDTEKEALQLLEEAMGETRILLVIDEMTPDLRIGLEQIEKAIRVKIRKIEMSQFQNDKGDVIVFVNDSDKGLEVPEVTSVAITQEGDYDVDFHLARKPSDIADIYEKFAKYAKKRGLVAKPTKMYIGFSTGKEKGIMLFSCVIRNSQVVFYSKAKVGEVGRGKLNIRDVRKIGHYTNHLPTEIVIGDKDKLDGLFLYCDKVIKKYS